MLSIIPVNGPDDFDGAMARAKRDRVGAILATSDPVTFLYRTWLVEAAVTKPKDAKLPGLTIPQSPLARADQVIE